MSAQRRAPKPFSQTEGKDALSEILDFGPEPIEVSGRPNEAERLRRIMEQLDEINQRINRLTSNE